MALLALAVCHLILLFPTLFMGRVLSPNDVFHHYEPWASLRPLEAQNPTLDAIATAVLPLATMTRREPGAFDRDRHIASGVPGFGASVILSPFVLVPVLLSPLTAMYTVIVVGKILFAFVFAYLWLREERMGKSASAVGAVIVSTAGIYSVWWLMQQTNATVLYPALLYYTARLMHRKTLPLAAAVILAGCAALAGFPAAVAYGAWATVLYAAYLALRQRLVPWNGIGKAAAASVIALLITAPSILTFSRFVVKTGYLASRENIAAQNAYPLHHFPSFVAPFRLGDPAAHLWIGDPALGYSNGFDEATLYLGLAAIPLSLAGLFRRKSRHRWFWLVFLAAVVVAIFGGAKVLGELPGIRYSPLTRLRLLLPLPAAYLVASGVLAAASAARRLGRSPRADAAAARWVAALLAVFAAADLALFAARFFPYLPIRGGAAFSTPTIRFLQAQPGIFRIAPFFTYLYPNTAEMYGLEDIRSHFSSEAKYRALMRRIDAGSWDSPTVIMFNGLKTDISDPLLSMLGVRYLVEQPNIDIVRWSILAKTVGVMTEAGTVAIGPGEELRRTIEVDAAAFHAAEITVGGVRAGSSAAALAVSLVRPETGEVVWSARYTPDEVARQQKLYVPISPYASAGQQMILRVQARGLSAELLAGGPREGEAPIFYRRVETPVILHRELPDGRIFQNLSALPRWWGVWDLRSMSDEAMLADPSIDFAKTAVTRAPLPTGPRLAVVPAERRRVTVRVLAYRSDHERVETDSPSPFLLVTSEKVDRDLKVEVDGREIEPVTVNTMFAAVPMEPGKHRVAFTWRIGRRDWPMPLAGALLLAVALGVERRRMLPRH